MSSGPRIDISVDAGESFGNWSKGAESNIFPYVSSANLACGFHAGDPATMLRTASLARSSDVRVGAHPGFRDLYGFGRRALDASPEDIYAETLYQIGALNALLRSLDMRVGHVSPHGALSWATWKRADVAQAVVEAIRAFDPALPLATLPNTLASEAAEAAGVRVIKLGFPERGYKSDGQLASRDEPGAVITDPGEAARRALAIASGEPIRTIDGNWLTVEADSLLVHGDNPAAVAIAQGIHEALTAAGIAVRAL